jgi:transcriptional regulator PpsR
MKESAHKARRVARDQHLIDPRAASRVFASAADLAFVLDRDDVIQEVTLGEAVEPHPGWNKLVGSRWTDTLAKDSQGKVEQLLREAREGRPARSREINQKAEGVGEIPFRFSAVMLDDQRRVAVLGRDQRAIATMQQRMLSTQQAMDREYGRLRQADTRYRVLFHVAAEGVLVADGATLRVLEANPAAATLLEEPAQSLQGKTLHELFEPRSLPAVQALLAAVEAGGRPADVQATIQGQTREVTVSASVFRQSGSALVLLRFWPTGAAQVPGGARGSRMLAVLDAMPDGFVVVGEDRRILSTNTAFCELVQQANEKQVIGQPLDRWLGRQGVDLNIMLANLREHGTVRNFSTIVRGDFGPPQEALVSAVAALDGKIPCLGFTIRTVSSRLTVVPSALPRSIEQLRELVGRVSLKELVRESADLIERLCIKAALDVSGNNRASAAQLLGLSRQGLYSKLRRHGLGELEPA